MKPEDCPCYADVKSLRRRLEAIQAKYDMLAMSKIKEEASKDGVFKGLRIASSIIGYLVIAVLLILAGRTVGFVDLLIKLVSSIRI